MTRTNLLRVASLALAAIATAASAQYVTVPVGAPVTITVPPGPVGVPGGRSGTTAQGMNDPDIQRELASRSMAARNKNASRPATASELAVGATIADNKGAEVGYIKSIDSDGVVVATAAGQVKVPSNALGKNQKGLLIGMSKADFDKLVSQAMGG